jgi:anti-sigma factor RsiW
MSTDKPIGNTELVMLVLDGEASAAQVQELEQRLSADKALRKEYESMKAMKEVTMSNRPPEPGAALWKTYWAGVYRRMERGFGWVLFSIGAIVLMLYGAWEFGRQWWGDDSIPVWVRISGASLAAGIIILFVSVLRERVYFHKNERYKDIER